MKRSTYWIAMGLLALAVPGWADCGFCLQGGTVEPPLQGQTAAEIGKPAPDFALKDLDGKEHKLSDLKGKVVVLEWTNHECPFVKRTHGKDAAVNQVVAKFQGKAVVWLAIDSSHFCEDKAESIRKWVKESEIAYPVLLDAAGKVGRMYGAKTTPHVFIVDRNGVLAYAGALDNDPYGQEQTKRNYVEEAVTALLNGSTVAKTMTQPYGCTVKYKE